jgi:mRNA-degrading endonuclease RelE of RelBE toxin-antitoxin system
MARAVRDVIPYLPPELKRKVKAALRSIAEDPYQAKELKDELAGLRSYRVGRTRLILQIAGAVVEVVAFGPRSDIYERAAAELSTRLRKTAKESPVNKSPQNRPAPPTRGRPQQGIRGV